MTGIIYDLGKYDISSAEFRREPFRRKNRTKQNNKIAIEKL